MADVMGPATLSLAQSIGAFQFFLPRLSDVRKATLSDVDIVADVRIGEVAAVALAIGVGAVASSLTGSPVPIVVSAVMVAIMIGVYEMTLRAPNTVGQPVRRATSD